MGSHEFLWISKCSLEFPCVPLSSQVFPWVLKCSPWVSLSFLQFPSVNLSCQVFPYVPMGSHEFPWVSKCSLEFPSVPLEFPNVPLSSPELPSVPLSSQMFPFSFKCSLDFPNVSLEVYEWSHFCQSGTFVAWCMNRGCLLGIWITQFLLKWNICCKMYEKRLLTRYMNYPIFVKVVHLLQNVWTEVAYWVYEWPHFEKKSH